MLFGYWLFRETGSTTAALVAVAIVAQSPLVMDTVWWYSASSFSWAIIGILVALLGVVEITLGRTRSIFLVFLGTLLGPAGTSLGHLAMPLAITRGLVHRQLSCFTKAKVTVAALGGWTAYLLICHVGGADSTMARLAGRGSIDPWAGIVYALSVPGRVLLPSLTGMPATWCVNMLPPSLSWSIAILLLVGLTSLAAWPLAPWRRRTIILGAAIMYMGYALVYSARACL
ncbi:MAG: hypothetical protein ACP5XB_01185, partial [Isosphaeraceae bacterium]